ncbi:MAG: hypothetical protein ACYC2K_04265 [Gemmatimonadales bacterium]
MLKLGILLAGAALATVPGTPGRAADLDGRWTGELVRANCDPAVARRVLCLDIRMVEGTGRNASRWSLSVPVAGLSGLPATSTGYTGRPLRFELIRESGTITFEGEIEAGWGDGRFGFAADPAYVERASRAGRPKPSPVELLSLAVGRQSRGEGRRYADYDRDVGVGEMPDVSAIVEHATQGAQVGVTVAMQVLESIDLGGLISQSLSMVNPQFIGDMTRLGIEGAHIGASVGGAVAGLDFSWIDDVVSQSLESADLSRLHRYDYGRRHRHDRTKRVAPRERDEP